MSDHETSPALVASADPSRARRVMEALRSAGFLVHLEVQGPAAAAVVGNGGADLMVLDLTLPDLNTTRLREALGEDEATPEPLEAVERRQIAAMLRHTRGNRRRAAQLLGLARSTLLAKIRRYGLETSALRGEELG